MLSLNKLPNTFILTLSMALLSSATSQANAEPLNRFANPPFYMVNGKRYEVLPPGTNYHQRGIASWYGPNFHGKATSSGDIYDMYSMTAASKVLPIPSYVRVTNLQNNKQIIVKINDRGPFHEGRIIDLSYAAAEKLGFARQGTTQVEVDAIGTTANAPAWSQNQKDKNPHLYLQVGAYRNKQYAQQLVQRLQQQVNTPAEIVSHENNQQLLYRVQLGPLKNESQGSKLNQQLASLGMGSGILVIG